jgi:hypothetical protein
MIIWSYVLTAMLSWVSPRPANVPRLYELSEVAWAIAKTDASPSEALQLAAIAFHESGFKIHALGKSGERGPWQIMPPGEPTAHEALRRMRYSYETCGSLAWYASGQCDRGQHAAKIRRETAQLWEWGHPVP